ncbi:hypothetical protein [Coprothermobacter platensis]|uniref:hypothetical protein n=1 Tax=Coprothermobacter platensis TaxID=108819 RepID=UPI0003824F67|nr:hypothetical protein [Coprothermobacter platensis]
MEDFFEKINAFEQEATRIVDDAATQARQRVENARSELQEKLDSVEKELRKDIEKTLAANSEHWESVKKEQVQSYNLKLSESANKISKNTENMADELLNEFLRV